MPVKTCTRPVLEELEPRRLLSIGAALIHHPLPRGRGASPSSATVVGSGTAMHTLIPMYTGTDPSDQTMWEHVISQNKPGTFDVILIVNIGWGASTGQGGDQPPDGGPLIQPGDDVAATTQFFNKVIGDAHQAGIPLLGYVSTDYGARPAADVAQDIATWKANWSGITGIFLDEQAMDATTPQILSYYEQARNVVLGKFGSTTDSVNDPRVVGNPGTVESTPDIPESYLGQGLNVSVDDIMVTEENPQLDGFRQPAWVQQYPRGRFAVLLYDSTVDQVTQAANDYFGNVYVTQPGSYDWSQLPSYWDQEVTVLSQYKSLKITLASSGGSVYLKRDSDNLHLDIWQNSASPGSGTPTRQVLLGDYIGVDLLGGSGNDQFYFDFGNGIPLPGGTGTVDGATGANTLTIVGTSGNDAASFDASRAALGNIPVIFGNFQSLAYATEGGSDSLSLAGSISLSLEETPMFLAAAITRRAFDVA